jgi:HPt (histidine-containing phosphotransfer) domain-containing protein
MIKIEGVDTEQGLANCNGSSEAYIEVLESFLEDTHAKIADLQFFDTNRARRWTKPELIRFTFAVHAIKGVSAIVGAAELSGKAAALEIEAKTGTIRQVKKDFPEFFQDVQRITGRIRDALAATGRAGSDKA